MPCSFSCTGSCSVFSSCFESFQPAAFFAFDPTTPMISAPDSALLICARPSRSRAKKFCTVDYICEHKMLSGRSFFRVVWKNYKETWEPYRVVSRLLAFHAYCKRESISVKATKIDVVEDPQVVSESEGVVSEVDKGYFSEDSVAKVSPSFLFPCVACFA